MSVLANAPILVLGLLGGALVDRASRPSIMVGAQATLAVAAGGFAIVLMATTVLVRSSALAQPVR